MVEIELTALIIEDEAPIRHLLTEVLRDKEVIAEAVATTREGLVLLTQKNYDVVFTDLNQEPTGVEVYQNAISRGMRAYIMTGGAKGELMTEAESVAGGNLIRKPFQLDDIYRKIELARQMKKPTQS